MGRLRKDPPAADTFPCEGAGTERPQKALHAPPRQFPITRQIGRRVDWSRFGSRLSTGEVSPTEPAEEEVGLYAVDRPAKHGASARGPPGQDWLPDCGAGLIVCGGV